MGPAWFLLGMLAAGSCRAPSARERREAREDALLQEREDEKEERRQEVFRAWERRHPGAFALRIAALVVVLGAVGLLVAHGCSPMVVHVPTIKVSPG